MRPGKRFEKALYGVVVLAILALVITVALAPEDPLARFLGMSGRPAVWAICMGVLVIGVRQMMKQVCVAGRDGGAIRLPEQDSTGSEPPVIENSDRENTRVRERDVPPEDLGA